MAENEWNDSDRHQDVRVSCHDWLTCQFIYSKDDYQNSLPRDHANTAHGHWAEKMPYITSRHNQSEQMMIMIGLRAKRDWLPRQPYTIQQSTNSSMPMPNHMGLLRSWYLLWYKHISETNHKKWCYWQYNHPFLSFFFFTPVPFKYPETWLYFCILSFNRGLEINQKHQLHVAQSNTRIKQSTNSTLTKAILKWDNQLTPASPCLSPTTNDAMWRDIKSREVHILCALRLSASFLGCCRNEHHLKRLVLVQFLRYCVHFRHHGQDLQDLLLGYLLLCWQSTG